MKLPKKLWGAHGPIPVRVKKKLKAEEGDECYGLYRPDVRVIFIDADIADETLQEVTLEHEWLHSVICDAGGEDLIEREKHEWVCSVVSAAIVSRRHSKYP